ncbi:MAG: dTMP kinase [Halanaerobiales bacterium]
MEGVLITFEGVEGSGKSTQVSLMANKLEKKGYEVVQTKEPGGTRLGEKIRHLLLDPENIDMNARTEILLYAADRAQDVIENIKPALKAGKVVLADRYIDSNIAYQGHGRKLDLKMVKRINRWAIRDIWPDLTILLDIKVEKGLRRARDLSPDNKGDRLEQEIISFHHRVRKAYLNIAKNDSRFKIIDADQDSLKVHRDIFHYVKERLL